MFDLSLVTEQKSLT